MRTSALAVALVLWVAPAHAQRPGQGDDDDSAALVSEGRAALRRGDYDDAGKALDQAIALNPRRVEAYVLRSAVFVARKRYKEGVRLMRRAQALAPDDEDVLTALGSQLVLSGDAAAGVPLLEQVVATNPLRYDAEQLLGHHWYGLGKWSLAIAAFEAYFADRPRELANEDAQHRVELADAYLRDHQREKALVAFREAAREGKFDLRARLGIAWATAARSCASAQPLLHELERVADTYPEVWLVEGQCACKLGNSALGTKLGQRYLARAPHGVAAGHALLGEAHALRGNLAEARRELEVARQLEPGQRRWTVRLASVLRSGGDAGGARAVLDKLGPPPVAAVDPQWWIELGEALAATGDAPAVIARLTPIAAELPRNAAILTVLGAAQLAAKQAEAAVISLGEADAIESTKRSRQLLADALASAAMARLSAGDAEAAEPMFARAAQLAPSAAILRDLGIAQLAVNQLGAAVATLDRAAALDPAPITLMLDARAHALLGDLPLARRLYERAQASDPADAVEIAIDWAASELAGGDPAIAVTALDRVAGRAASGPLAQRHGAALAQAHHAAGLAALRATNTANATVELLKASVAGEPVLAIRCDLALAALVSGGAAAKDALEAVSGERCPFPPPADRQAVPILRALTESLNPRQAGTALGRLDALASKSSGAASALLGTATRVVALEAAGDAYRSDRVPQARRFLAAAQRAHAQIGGEEVAHDLALLDLADGQVDAAIAELERLAPKLPDALVTLGIAYERKGEPEKALDAWRRARKAGARFAQLTDWIEAKERFYGALP